MSKIHRKLVVRLVCHRVWYHVAMATVLNNIDDLFNLYCEIVLMSPHCVNWYSSALGKMMYLNLGC